MSISIIHGTTPRARKNYSCIACDFLFAVDFPSELGLTYAEKRAVVQARQRNYKILKGEKYIRQFNTDGSHTWTFRAIPDIHSICLKHGLYKE